MKADYDSVANAIQITLESVPRAEYGDEVHERGIVDVLEGRAVGVELLYPDLGTREPLAAVAEKYGLDLEALEAAARSAVAAPDRVVTLEVSATRASVD